MIINEIIDYLHSIAPNQFQEEYDNAGLIVGDKNAEVTNVLISLDVTEEIVAEAQALNCNLIVSHHPIVFKGLKRFNGSNYVERTVIKAIKSDIALFAIHTNLDNVYQHGVNQMIASKIGLKNTKILKPKKEISHNGENIGAGMIGELDQDFEPIQFLHHLKKSMALKTLKHTKLLEKPIRKVALCGGSGMFLLQESINQDADIYISADFKYHEYFDANDEIIIADIGHFESEQYTIQLIHKLISQKFRNFASHCTKINTNPINYL